MLGSPIPKIMQVIIVSTKVAIMLVPPKSIIALAILSPNPVMLVTAIIIPTTAQAMATETVPRAPPAKASNRSFMLILVLKHADYYRNYYCKKSRINNRPAAKRSIYKGRLLVAADAPFPALYPAP